MVNDDSFSAISAATMGNGDVFPLYDSYCFSRIPGTIRSLIEGKERKDALPLSTMGNQTHQANKVVVIFLDALGWNMVEPRLDSDKALERFRKGGVLSQITSQFPSTTPVHVTTIQTGKPLAEHGIVDGRYYEPVVGDTIIPFAFCRAADYESETLYYVKIEPSYIYGSGNFYTELREKYDISSWSFGGYDEVYSTYSKAMNHGSYPINYSGKDSKEGFKKLHKAINQYDGPGYYFFYYSALDSLSHRYGPFSEDAQGLVDESLGHLNDFLGNLKRKDTAVLLIADHGQVQVNVEGSFSILQQAPKVELLQPINKMNRVISLGGSHRSPFIYFRASALEDGFKMLRDRLGGIADVHKSADLIEKGCFGPNPSSAFLGRLNGRYPAVHILPKQNRTAVWRCWGNGSKYKKSNLLKGHHGGLSMDEMIIPFAFLPPGSF